MTTAQDLINAIKEGKSSEIQHTFDTLVTGKLSAAIDAYRTAVTEHIFNNQNAQDE